MSIKQKRVLIVTECGLRWPSGMVRAMQFQPLFQRCNTWRAEYLSRQPEHILKMLEYGQHGRGWRLLIWAIGPLLTAYYHYWSRKQDERIIKCAADSDVVCIVKSPGLPLYKRLRRLSRPRLMMDISDAVWLQGKKGDWKELDAMLAEVHGVICECEYVANYARKFNSNVVVISDAPQVEVFDRLRNQIRRDPNQIVLGWIGMSMNIGPLYKILEPLEALFARHSNLHLRVVGAGASMLPPFENVRWSCLPSYNQEEMVREVLGFDIGLLPLFHNEDGRGRGTLKAKVYMSGEAVAVCEDYGENPTLVRDGFNGVLASSPQQWFEKLDRLVTHVEERQAIARRGLETIRNEYTAKHVFARMLGAYERVLEMK